MKNLFILTTLIVFTRCEPVPTQSTSVNKKLVLDDYNYESTVGMVQLLPIKNGQPSILENPVVSLDGGEELSLTFDILTDQFQYLSAKIYHCNKDWSKSILRDMEFLNEINVYRISQYDFSLNSTQPYISYSLRLPKPRLSGNYIISIFRRGNEKDILFNRKFVVVNNTSKIDQLVKVSNTVSKRDINQQIEFSINYGDLQVNNPSTDISVAILQNHNWQTAIRSIQPTLIRPNEGFLEYRSLNLENNFPGWNEFRFFDLRTLDVTGRNVGKISNEGGRITVQLGLDKSRGGEVYTQNLRDVNGNFILQNSDPGDVQLNSDYAKVYFYIKSERLSEDVYVTGRFNNWKLSDDNRMRYNSQAGMYYTSLFLKQGYYDYQYYVQNREEPYKLEGSHLLTENDYEIIVYYRNPGNLYDEVIGYKRFNSTNQ